MTAVGIHAHPTRKLGVRPGNPDRPVLMLDRYLTGAVPVHPPKVDHLQAKGLTFGLYRNDAFGVCGPTYVANLVRMVSFWLTGSMEQPSQDDVFDLYRRSGNPDFDPATGAGDRGVDMDVMLTELVRNGIGPVDPATGKRKWVPLAYGKIPGGRLDKIWAAIAIFGGVGFGLNLQTAQQAQTDTGLWDYSPSAPWGGHATLGGSLDDVPGTTGDRTGNITWDLDVQCTDAFLAHQLDAAYVVVWPWNVSTPGFQQGVDLGALAADFEALTGRRFPVPVQPSPPVPGPVPGPPGPVDLAAAVRAMSTDPRVVEWLSRHHLGAAAEVAVRVREVISALP